MGEHLVSLHSGVITNHANLNVHEDMHINLTLLDFMAGNTLNQCVFYIFKTNTSVFLRINEIF